MASTPPGSFDGSERDDDDVHRVLLTVDDDRYATWRETLARRKQLLAFLHFLARMTRARISERNTALSHRQSSGNQRRKRNRKRHHYQSRAVNAQIAKAPVLCLCAA